MDSWIWQPGYPLISARLDGTTLVLGAAAVRATATPTTPPLFVVPLHLRIDGVESKVLLDGDELRVRAAVSASSSVVVNAGGHGFMRVAYDDALRARLVGRELASLTIIDRYNLVDDAWNAVVAGRLAAADFLDVRRGLRRRARPGRVAGDRDRPARRRPAWSTATPYAAFQRRVAALGRPGARRRSGGTRSPARTTSPPSCAACCWATLAVLGNDADAQARCRAILETATRLPTPSWSSAATNAVAARRHRRRLRPLPRRASARRRRRRSSCASCTRWPSSPQAAQIQRTIDLAFSGEVQDAERTVPAEPVHRQPVPRRDGVERGAPALGRGQRASSRTTPSCA